MRKYLTLVIFTVVCGCATGSAKYPADKMNFLEVGMTRHQVVQILGMPNSTSAIDNTVYLLYMLHERNHPPDREHTEFFVRVVNGKVESFGRSGDFDSTKVPETKTTIDLNIKNKDSK